MPKLRSFSVVAELPKELAVLRDIAFNLWWTWNHHAKTLFYRIGDRRFERVKRNPVALINTLSWDEIRELQKDPAFIAQLDELAAEFEEYTLRSMWWNNQRVGKDKFSIAYFSAEFGLHESLQIYSGGLGVLAGDMLKASSDLGLPLVGVGLLYYEGYFHQYLNAEGWQQEKYPQIELLKIPIQPIFNQSGERLVVTLRLEGKDVRVQAWEVHVGRVKLVLLDTNLPENDASSRGITARLYGGDVHTRIRQEIVLGMGGLRMLRAMGIDPDICHMNEGHSAFLALEQLRTLCTQSGLTFDEALLAIRPGNLFTTHTPVPAGNDAFPSELISAHFAPLADEMKIELETLLRLGRIHPLNTAELFSMTVLALRTCGAANAVSKLHRSVSRKLWHGMWPELPIEEVPIESVTNGVHTATWASRDIAEVYDSYLGSYWKDQSAAEETWARVSNIPDEELWRIKNRRRSLLVAFCRERLRDQLFRRGAGRIEVENAASVLDPNVLTIGFARRFASYKRATLLLRDLNRLIRLANHPDHPVQFVFSGKAHPADHPGKQLIAEIIHLARHPDLRNRFVFIEDYDAGVARNMLQGVDVWLNNPRRPLEASGTSGMKAAVNGTLNLSILDGWWCEGYDRQNGWSIGSGEEYDDPGYQDDVESRSLYDLLEHEIIPTFYDRAGDQVPRSWMQLVKHSIRTVSPQFSASRMALEYANKFYLKLGRELPNDHAERCANAKQSAQELRRFREHWSKIRILSVSTPSDTRVALGKSLNVQVNVALGPFKPEDIAVEVYCGEVDVTEKLHESTIVRLQKSQAGTDAEQFTFSGELQADRAGSYGFAIRVLPVINGKVEVSIPGLITWWQ